MTDGPGESRQDLSQESFLPVDRHGRPHKGRTKGSPKAIPWTDGLPDYLNETVEWGGQSGELQSRKAIEWIIVLRITLTPDEYRLRRSAGWTAKAALASPPRPYPPRRRSGRMWRGVSWHTTNKKWLARAGRTGKRRLGYYDKEIDAAIAYNLQARALYGHDAILNEV